MKLSDRKIFHFNPTCEIAIANGSPYYLAPALLREFEEELAPIMMFFASEQDHVLKNEAVPDKFIDTMAKVGFFNSKILSKDASLEIIKPKNEFVELNPWGWSPAELNYLLPFNQRENRQQRSENITKQSLFERKHAVGLVSKLITKNSHPLFPKVEQLPVLMNSVERIEAYLDKYQQMVLKSPLSSSGRGIQLIRKNKLNESNKRWIKTNLTQQGYLIAEPIFNKKMDLSFQFEFKLSGQIDFLGTSFFETNNNGQYLGHHLNYFRQNEEKYLNENELNSIANLILQQLNNSILKKHYYGFLGVDALVYEENKQIKIHPCLEINPRYNMGILSKNIENRIHQESTGIFQVYYHPTDNFVDFAKNETKKNPPFMADQKLIKGFVPITAPTRKSKFGAFVKLF